MSDDRTLLEKAARAAGLPMHRYCEAWNAMARYTLSDGYHGPSWNPLTDDGDALRLAVKLKITWGYVGNFCVINDGTSTIGQPIDGDPGGATRRAIVRAAASLGSLDEAGKD